MAEGSGGLGHIVTPADRLARIAHDPQHVCERQLASCGCFLPHLLVCTADRSPGAACAERTWPILPDIERHLAEARLPVGKTLSSFDFEAVPMVSKAQVMALTAGDSWLEKGANLLLFGPPGGGKSHLAAAIGLALVENGWRVLFMRTSDLVQRLQIARRELALEGALAKLDKYHLLILDDIVYVSKDQAETSVLFELIGTRYERRSMLITANQPFGEWARSSQTKP